MTKAQVCHLTSWPVPNMYTHTHKYRNNAFKALKIHWIEMHLLVKILGKMTKSRTIRVLSLCVRVCVCALGVHKTKGSNFNWIQMPAAWALWTAANMLAHFQFWPFDRFWFCSGAFFKIRYPSAINSNKLDWRWLDRP